MLDEGVTPGGKPFEHSQMVKDHYDALRFTLEQAQSETKAEKPSKDDVPVQAAHERVFALEKFI